MGQNNGLEAKIFKGGTRITLKVDSGESPPLPIRVSLYGQTSYVETTIPIMEDHMINSQISHSKQALETDL